MPNVYELITQRIIEQLEAGTVPWRIPWRGDAALPRNLHSNNAYRGINVFLLSCAPYSSPYWLTFRQAQALGGQVRKGSHGYPIVFWRWLDRPGACKGEEDVPSERHARAPLLRYYTVFNVDQCDGLPIPTVHDAATPFQPIERAQAILDGMPDPPSFRLGAPLAAYSPGPDVVLLPAREAFATPEHYYSTAFHECAHSTGHERRLSRKGVTDPTRFGSHEYSREELVAEMTAAFLCGHVALDAPFENSVAYLAGWLKVLRGDSRLIVQAAANAQQATDYILARASADDDGTGSRRHSALMGAQRIEPPVL